jgi:hypothetical protein
VADGEHRGAGEPRTAGDLVHDAVACRGRSVGERDRAGVLIDRARDDLVDVDQERVDRAERRRPRDVADVDQPAAF